LVILRVHCCRRTRPTDGSARRRCIVVGLKLVHLPAAVMILAGFATELILFEPETEQ